MREGWTYKLFEDCLMKATKPNQVQTSEYHTGTKYPIISQEDKMVSGYCDDSSLLYHIEKPIVIFGDHTRVLKYVDFDFVVGADGVKILIPKDFLRAKFLLYYLRWYNVPSLGYSRHYKLLKEINIPVPPLSEQQRIVNELDLLSSIIEKKKAQLKEYDQLAQSIFFDMFGDPVSNEKGWEVKKLGEVCAQKTKIARASKSFTSNSPIEYIDISSIDKNSKTITTTTSYIFCDAPSRAQQIVEYGDILISLVRPNLQNIAIVLYNKDNLVGSSGFCVIRPKQLTIKEYLFYVIRSSYFTDYLMQRVSGANYPAVREEDVKSYTLPIPPLTLQQSFASKIEAIEQQKALIHQSITEAETLFNSRMDYYFN